jgi:acylphosphatase
MQCEEVEMAKHLRIAGVVQGVGYRASFEAQARSLGLSGWVRNRRDGSVEALVRGDEDALRRIADWARRGPSAARVSNVSAVDVDDAQVEDGSFHVLRTE